MFVIFFFCIILFSIEGGSSTFEPIFIQTIYSPQPLKRCRAVFWLQFKIKCVNLHQIYKFFTPQMRTHTHTHTRYDAMQADFFSSSFSSFAFAQTTKQLLSCFIKQQNIKQTFYESFILLNHDRPNLTVYILI